MLSLDRVDREQGNKNKATDVSGPRKTRVAHWLVLVCPRLLLLTFTCVFKSPPEFGLRSKLLALLYLERRGNPVV